MRYDPWDGALVEGRLVKRYKRFLADVETADGIVTAHCPNSGSMVGMKEPGSEVRLLHVPDPKRKLKWTWELVRPPGEAWVGCNTNRPNEVVAHFLREGKLASLGLHGSFRREVKYGQNSRIDILLEGDGLHYVEIKNTTLADGAVARFPDAVTARGAKHMDELVRMVDEGHEATVVFFVNRRDVDSFSVADDIDSTYAAAFARAEEAGVRMLPLGMDVGPDGWTIRGELPRAAGD